MSEATQDKDASPVRVGVREFRGNMTDYLRRARDGASFLITSRDEVVAELHPPSSPKPPRSLIADRANDVLVSAASLWEFALRLQFGKLRVDVQDISNAISRNGVALLGINVAHLMALTGLPRHHKDPFDHLLIAQAMSENASLMSDDWNMPQNPVQIIGCSA